MCSMYVDMSTLVYFQLSVYSRVWIFLINWFKYKTPLTNQRSLISTYIYICRYLTYVFRSAIRQDPVPSPMLHLLLFLIRKVQPDDKIPCEILKAHGNSLFSWNILFNHLSTVVLWSSVGSCGILTLITPIVTHLHNGDPRPSPVRPYHTRGD